MDRPIDGRAAGNGGRDREGVALADGAGVAGAATYPYLVGTNLAGGTVSVSGTGVTVTTTEINSTLFVITFRVSLGAVPGVRHLSVTAASGTSNDFPFTVLPALGVANTVRTYEKPYRPHYEQFAGSTGKSALGMLAWPRVRRSVGRGRVTIAGAERGTDPGRGACHRSRWARAGGGVAPVGRERPTLAPLYTDSVTTGRLDRKFLVFRRNEWRKTVRIEHTSDPGPPNGFEDRPEHQSRLPSEFIVAGRDRCELSAGRLN